MRKIASVLLAMFGAAIILVSVFADLTPLGGAGVRGKASGRAACGGSGCSLGHLAVAVEQEMSVFNASERAVQEQSPATLSLLLRARYRDVFATDSGCPPCRVPFFFRVESGSGD